MFLSFGDPSAQGAGSRFILWISKVRDAPVCWVLTHPEPRAPNGCDEERSGVSPPHHLAKVGVDAWESRVIGRGPCPANLASAPILDTERSERRVNTPGQGNGGLRQSRLAAVETTDPWHSAAHATGP